MNSRPSRTYTQPQAVLGAQQTEGTGLRKDLSLEVLLTEPSLAAQIPINLQTPKSNPPVDGDVLHHLLSVCILQRDAPWRHCQNHLLKLASSNPCLAVEKKKPPAISANLERVFTSSPLLEGAPQTLYSITHLDICCKGSCCRDGTAESGKIRHVMHITFFKSFHTTQEGTETTFPSVSPSSLCCGRHSYAPRQGQVWEKIAVVQEKQLFHSTQAHTRSLLHPTLLLGRALEFRTRIKALPRVQGLGSEPRAGSHRGHNPADGSSSHVFSFRFFYQRHAQVLEGEAHPLQQRLLHVGPALRKL